MFAEGKGRGRDGRREEWVGGEKNGGEKKRMEERRIEWMGGSYVCTVLARVVLLARKHSATLWFKTIHVQWKTMKGLPPSADPETRMVM